MTTKKQSLPALVEQGKSYLWCRCGLSQTLPLCDFSHKINDSLDKPLSFVAEKTTTVYLCSCNRTLDPPYCDGINCDD